jgi:hypothetical protein
MEGEPVPHHQTSSRILTILWPLVYVKFLDANMSAIPAAKNIYSRRAYRDTAGGLTTILILVLIWVAQHTNGLAPPSIGLTLRSGIAMLTPTLY